MRYKGGTIVEKPHKVVVEQIKREYINFLRKNRKDIVLPSKIWKILKENNAILAGGFLTDIYIESISHSDVDFFFRNANDFTEANNLLTGLSLTLSPYQTDNAITYFVNYGLMQLIRANFGTPQEIINEFDLSVSKVALDLKDEKMYFGENFLKHISENKVRIEKFGSQQTLFLRVLKYVRDKGFILDEMDYMKLTILLQAMVNKPEKWVNTDAALYGYDTSYTPKEALRELNNIMSPHIKSSKGIHRTL